MVEVDRIYTDNPFVDNLFYYTKYIALNCVIKDEDEALQNETPESLNAGSIYIACVEGHAVYEMFDFIPPEILEKYITARSNLDEFAENDGALLAYLDSINLIDRTRTLNRLSKIARTIYIDHYYIMTNYIKSLSPTWATDNKPLYDQCVNETATYKDLLEQLPEYTNERIISQYLNNYDNSDIASFASSLQKFEEYIATRKDTSIVTELQYISRAMREVFKSHYDMMLMRKYISEEEVYSDWINFNQSGYAYQQCVAGTATWKSLYYLFPKNIFTDVLNKYIPQADILKHDLLNNMNALEEYLLSKPNKAILQTINENMRKIYIRKYNMNLDFDMYGACITESADYFQLSKYLPYETRKIIINFEVDEVSNLEIYGKDKTMLNAYLNTLPKEQAKQIKDAITKEMSVWYVNNFVEKNNYYRTLIGQPPMDKDGNIYEDTLLHSYNEKSESFIKFGNQFIHRIPKEIYPDIHWRNQLYQFDAYDIGILNEYGIIDDFITACNADINSSRYRYLKYLGDNKLDLYTCRKAANFQLISIPTIESDYMKRMFADKFAVNRDYVIRAVYSDAYKFESDYYNKFMIIFILINTMMDILCEIPKLIINRDVFDARCIRYIFESYGIPYYSEIPIKYQQAMLKNLNILIKYKSSTKNMVDICSLFGFADVKVFGYYLMKERLKDPETGEYLIEDQSIVDYNIEDLYIRDVNGSYEDYNGIRYAKLKDHRNFNEKQYLTTITVQTDNGSEQKKIINNSAEVYLKDPDYDIFLSLQESDYFKKIKANTATSDLKFIKVPIDDYLTEYKNDDNYHVTYDEVTFADEGHTWDGGLLHEKVKRDVLNMEFNAVKSKYISIETVTEMSELAFQISYFYNMLFDNFYSEDALTIEVPYIQNGHKFRFMDIICYLFSLMYLYNELEDNIMYSPTQILYVKGYNFNSDLNEVLKDTRAFTQTLDPMKQENIFDINERIQEDGYDYQKAMSMYDIKSFNLNADIDELDKWLAQYQLSLDDFVVDDTLTVFDQIITLRQFYSLNNSYYQKSIFNPKNLIPTEYNQEIKYAFKYELYEKLYLPDINDKTHEYVIEHNGLLESYYMAVISDTSDMVYIMAQDKYANDGVGNVTLYWKYNKSKDKYLLDSVDYYICIEGTYHKLLNGNIYVKNSDGEYAFAANVYYTKNELGQYEEVANPKFFYIDNNGKKILNFGNYYIFVDGKWILDPDNCYIIIEKNGVKHYVLLKDADADEWKDVIVTAESCYILHSDGHFIPLVETDYYRRKPDGSYEYDEEECYIISKTATQYYDPSANPRVYYQKLTEYYNANKTKIYADTYYVKDPEGNYISEKYLLSPNNCYWKSEHDNYFLVMEHLLTFAPYKNPIVTQYVLILQEDNNYNRYRLIDRNYELYNDPERIYVKNSETEFIIVLYPRATYEDTKSMIVVLNKDITGVIEKKDDEYDGKYDPERTDDVWDENDYFYKDPSYDDKSIGMNGENKWYYRKPGEDLVPDEDIERFKVGSGFVLHAETYLGSIKIEEGCRYYMSFDVETNFATRMQICCEADSECNASTDRNYDFDAREIQHVSQTFIANSNTSPRIEFLIYDFDTYPIENGNYIIVKNIRFIKAFSDHYIAQDIPSYDKLQELYKTNEACYKYLATLMVNCSDFDTYMIYKKLFDSLMTSKYNKEAFRIGENRYAKTYTEFLQTRDAVLFDKLMYLRTLDIDAMRKEIADNIIEVTYAIDSMMDIFSYGYLYSYFPAVSASYIQEYICKVINFFKSWKVQLLGINTIYRFDDELENTVKILYDEQYRNKIRRQDQVYINHSVKINPMDAKDPDGYLYTEKYDDLIDISHRYTDTVQIKDAVRLISRTANRLEYTDHYEKIHLVLNRDEIKANIDENGDLIVSTDSGLSVQLPNNLLYDTDEQEQDAFAALTVNEINRNTSGIVIKEDK